MTMTVRLNGYDESSSIMSVDTVLIVTIGVEVVVVDGVSYVAVHAAKTW